MFIPEKDYLAHYGVLRKSGRYPWGSGGTHDQNNRDFLGYVEELQKQGLSEKEVAQGIGFKSTTELRTAKSIARQQIRAAETAEAVRLRDKGMSNVAIGERMGKNESSIRALLDENQRDKNNILETTAKMLKAQVDEKGIIDVGTGVDAQLGISSTKLNTAVARLKQEGYEVHSGIKVPQLTMKGQYTNMKVLALPGTTWGDVMRNRDKIRQINEATDDGGRSYFGLKPVQSVNSKRVAIRYAEDGGTDADGVIYLRRGAKDLNLGASSYAQVRIAVDGTHYLKGMAMYRDDLPPGVDLLFNTNKKDTGNKLDAMKPMKTDKDGNLDQDNPFGAVIKPHGQRGALNVVNEEGDWSEWSKNLSSQMLSKQAPSLAKRQLDLLYERKRAELDQIMSTTNPTVRRRLLESFADDADSAAVHLKAAHLPRQSSHVILPVNGLKPNEVYAPNFKNGERVVLIRYPHGGKFEIPELTVNNRNAEGRRLLGSQPKDAIGINSKVAERLSGADFDGDTVLVIPNNRRDVQTSPALEGLKGFDPQARYPGYEGMPKMSAKTKQLEMGNVSNLITDMTIKRASQDELARAVRHSMVVIDAEKHGLNWKQSALDNGIAQLKAKYQGGDNKGASTLISRATSEIRVDDRKPRSAKDGGPIDRATGKKVYTPTGATTLNAKGQTVSKQIKSEKLAETDDAHTLSSGTIVERVYADHSNRLKAVANEARKSMIETKSIPYSPSAKKAYANEVESLNVALRLAQRNAPLERQAQVIANAVYRQKALANPDMDDAEKKKVKSQALQEARNRTGAGKQRIYISDREWTAIQAGAITNNKLQDILANADLDRVKELATPRTAKLMTPTKISSAKAMLNAGYTPAEVADALGVSVTTLRDSVK